MFIFIDKFPSINLSTNILSMKF